MFMIQLMKFGYRFLFLFLVWYKITMMWTRKKDVEVNMYGDLKDIPKAFNFGKLYRPDVFFGTKSDHLTHPSALQDRLNKGGKFGDCDDHAIYWCVTLLKSGLARKTWFALYHMTDEKTGKISGHAVCIFTDKDNILHWADYGKPKPIRKIKDFMYQSSKNYGKIPFVGAIIKIDGIKRDDTPEFGKITRLQP